MFIFFSIIVLCFLFVFLSCRLLFALLVQLVFESIMIDPLSSSKPAPPNPFSNLNLNINLNLETMVHNDMYNLKCRQLDTLYEPLLFEPLKQIRVSHAMFKVMFH